MHVYVSRTAGFRKEDQLFVSWATLHKDKVLSRQRLSHWIVEAISLAYRCRGLQPPECLRAHPTRGVAISWALFKGVSVQDLCAAASWATPHTCMVLQAGCLTAILSTISARGKCARIPVIITTQLNIIYGFEKFHAIQERSISPVMKHGTTLEKEFWVT